MKIIAYMNLLPRHIHLDLTTRAVCLDASARGWNMGVFPDEESAAAALSKDEASYAVTAELPDGSVFEVRGSVDQTEGRGGSYVAGLFDNLPAAHAATNGLGAQGQPGSITVLPAPVNVFSDVGNWREAFDLSQARKVTTAGPGSLISIVELAADDARAIGAADPEFAIWLKLNEKFAPRAGATA